MRDREIFRVDAANQLDGCDVQESRQSVHNSPFVESDALLSTHVKDDFKQELEHQSA